MKTSLDPFVPCGQTEKDIAMKTSNQALLYMSAYNKPPRRQRSRATLRANYPRRIWPPCPERENDLQAKTDESFNSLLYPTPALSVTSCQTSFYRPLVDLSAAINCVDPWRPWLWGPRWLWRKPSLVDIKNVLRKNPCVWVDVLYQGGWLDALPVGGPSGISWEMMTPVHQPKEQDTPDPFR